MPPRITISGNYRLDLWISPESRRRPGGKDQRNSIRNPKGVAAMRKLSTLLAVAVCAIGLSAGSASATTRTVTVAMKDPGCHWFLVSGKYLTKYTVAGPVSLKNFDEASLRIVGPKGVVAIDKVGKSAVLKPGLYHITMVGQAPDDNHLILTVK
jgi:hypothetical protein